jgi:hypothetical protein
MTRRILGLLVTLALFGLLVSHELLGRVQQVCG